MTEEQEEPEYDLGPYHHPARKYVFAALLLLFGMVIGFGIGRNTVDGCHVTNHDRWQNYHLPRY